MISKTLLLGNNLQTDVRDIQTVNPTLYHLFGIRPPNKTDFTTTCLISGFCML